jgi:hypothetical protein
MLIRPLIAATLLSLPVALPAQEKGSSPVKTYERVDEGAILLGKITTVMAKVMAIDPELRQVTLQNEAGHLEIMTCGPEVVNFSQIRVGDKVTFHAQETLSFIRLTPGTRLPSASSRRDISKSPPGSPPGGAFTDYQQTVATVATIDKDAPSITLNYPDKTIRTFQLREASRLKGISEGDTILVSSMQRLAITVDPAK